MTPARLAEAAALKEHVYRARFLVARALEAQGLVDDAVIELETLLSPRVGTVMQIKVGIALSRCYRESGDFSKAVEVGEMILEQLADTPLDTSDEAVQMAVTLAAAYFERGDTSQAVRVCRKAVDQGRDARVADRSRLGLLERQHHGGTPRAAVRDAIPLAERALPCWPRDRTVATSAVCAPSSAIMQLRMDPPQIDEAQEHLASRGCRVQWCSAGPRGHRPQRTRPGVGALYLAGRG